MDKQTARRRKAGKQPTQDSMIQATAVDAPGVEDAALADGFAQQSDIYGQGDQEAEQASAEEQRQARLDSFAGALAKKRQAAVDARRMSGIEDTWREDEEFYEGIDDANRGESVTLKPRDWSGTGGASIVEGEAPTGSTVFLNITRPYVDFSAGRAADMLLPTDDRNWDLRETPMPDVIKAFGDETPLNIPGSPMTTVGQAAQQMVAEASAKVAKARTRIDDWHEEGQFNAEQRKVLKDAAKVGVGILKGPFPMKRTARAIVKDPATGAMKMQTQKKTAPVSKRISYWNFYPSAGCGDDIHMGDGTWEKDKITARQLRDLIGTMDSDEKDAKPMYLEAVIKTCLSEGPQRKFEADQHYMAPDAENFEIWYFQGVATPEDLSAAGVNVDKDEVVPVMITMVNDRVIKAALSTLDSGDFTYDVMVWQPREGHWAGIGVGRQVRAPQRMLNAGVRNILDNAGLGAGPQIIISDDIRPVGRGEGYGIKPRKTWRLNKDSNIDDVRKAFAAIEIPMVTDELMQIIQFSLKMAEDVTGLPMLMQGQQGQASETVGGMQMLSNNSNTPLRAIAKLYDDRVGVPHNLRYYEWLLMYGPENDEKGEFIVAARGSSALFERDAQNQAILQMGAIVENPKYKINPEKWFAQFLKAQRLAPADFQYTDAEWAKIEQDMKNAPPPVDPKVQTAQIAADASIKRTEMTIGVQREKIAKDTDRDAVFAKAEAERTAVLADAKQRELDQRERLAMLDYANQHNETLENVKAKLADTAMRLQTQRDLSAMSLGIDLHKHHSGQQHEADQAAQQAIAPPTEPAGRAPNGESFQA